jgi:GAF domain-containing protein
VTGQRGDLITQVAATADAVAPALGLPAAEELLAAVCRTTRRALGAAACSVAVLDEPGGELLYRAADGEGADTVVGVRLPVDRGLAGYVASSGQAIGVEHVQADPRFASDVAARTGYVPDRLIAVPVAAPTGEVLGVLTVLDPTLADGDGRSAMEIAGAAGEQAALSIAVAAAAGDLGRVLLKAVADAVAADDPDLAAALRRRAANAKPPSAELLEVSARLAELRSLGPAVSATAGRVLDELITYARAARGRRR